MKIWIAGLLLMVLTSGCINTYERASSDTLNNSTMNEDLKRSLEPVDLTKSNIIVVHENSARSVIATFRNSAGSDGSFEVMKGCSKDFSIGSGGLIERLNINANSSVQRTYSVSFYSASNEEVTGNCTIRLKETTTQEHNDITFSVVGIQEAL